MTYTFDTTALQEDAITYKRDRVNAERAAAVPPLPPFESNGEYVAYFVGATIFAPLLVEYVEVRTQKIANAYRTANDATRKTVDGALKV